MSSDRRSSTPSDQAERVRALDSARSVLVEAPAGSGKTDLLTRRFLRLLAEVDSPAQIVAITFTRAATAEMVDRIVAELEKAAARAEKGEATVGDALSMEALASRAYQRSQERGWNLVELSSQLRVTTIDSFCRELAVRRPLLSGLGSEPEIVEDPWQLYRQAARRTLEQIDGTNAELRAALAQLLLWRDNSWQELEDLLVGMLAKRDRWMQEIVFKAELDWEKLRALLERPFAQAVRVELERLSALLDQAPGAREEAHALARFACVQKGDGFCRDLAELAEFPAAPFESEEELETARAAFSDIAQLLLKQDGAFKSRFDVTSGFPADRKLEKARVKALAEALGSVAGLAEALAGVRSLPPARYTEEDWAIVRACLVLLRRAAPQLRVEFAEAGAVDFTEVAQIALDALKGEDGIPSDAVLEFVDEIRHLLVDEFQDTSRRQHRLLAHLIAAWPEPEGRSCFVVGDPKQSIYFFRDADAELFPQVRDSGLAIPDDEPFRFDGAKLEANFRSARGLVEELNGFFSAVFAERDGSGVEFMAARPERAGTEVEAPGPRVNLHWEFMPASSGRQKNEQTRQRIAEERAAALEEEIHSIVELIAGYSGRIEAARGNGRKLRVAVLGRARSALTPIAEALRKRKIAFRAVELEKLGDRPEVRDLLSIARAMANPQDRVAWLSMLRAPWCGLSLADLHMLAGGDDPELLARPVRELIRERLPLLKEQGSAAVARVLEALEAAERWRAERPASTLGTWLREAWLSLGGAACVNEAERANVELLLRALDSLPEGEQDVAGPALDAALEDLTALPDPRADSNCGVQLMTIHKAKGLEFEVVIVPELQAGGGRGRADLLSWLERGLEAPGEEGEITEFLVAPIQSRGADRGKAKAWVDRERLERERQEMRRLLYVAATRAREELHLFARPEYKDEGSGELELQMPRQSLLRTAWPAVEQEVRRSFEVWRTGRGAEEFIVPAMAAGGDKVLEMPRPVKPAILRRLPTGFNSEAAGAGAAWSATPVQQAGAAYSRHEGGLLSRALGVAVHRIFEELAGLVGRQGWDAAAGSIAGLKPRAIAEVREMGLDRAQAERTVARAAELAGEALSDPVARWILAPRAEAATEQSWAGVDGGAIRTVRADRVFLAGLKPGTEGDGAWWIVDWKTAHAEGVEPAKALPELRAIFAPQLEMYARVLRELKGADAAIRVGLYYPRMKAFDWWEA
jgi:ATP-dependent exoDNAse (exonuclease V) beta subunit